MTKDHPRDLSRGKTIGIRVGEPLYPTGDDPVADTDELHRRLAALLDDAIEAYPDEEQPPGSWWLPASRGGSAPTPERAKELELEEKAARAARKGKARCRPGRRPGGGLSRLLVVVEALCRQSDSIHSIARSARSRVG